MCDYSAFQHINLRRHIECVHEKLKEHQCNICQKSFGLKGSLSKHIEVVHERKKPFKCNLCRKMFGQKKGLRRHTDNLHFK
jgi:uncharacterized Zn-finger protein